MQRIFTTLLCMLLFTFVAQAQLSTQEEVYQIFQSKCATCHNGADAAAGLDLEGVGATEAARIQDVYNNIYRQTPANATAASVGDSYIYPGRPDRSFLFRKINNGLESTLQLAADEEEGISMPPYGEPQLTEVEKEMIRQWLLYGAPTSGTVVDRTIIEDYYAGNGEASFPDGPPPAPAPEEGYQIKMGPFYLAPSSEVEFFQKYELTMEEAREVDRLDMLIGNSSHHLLVYDFEPGGDQVIEDGLRLESFHDQIGLVAAVQEATDLKLPEGTAFRWAEDLVLDLNSHYINYSASLVHQAEVYINVYTQDMNTAAQEMHTELIVNPNIYIPNNENTVVETGIISANFGEIYLWGLMGHTHQYGKSYKVWRREAFQQEELIYDAACPQGEPGCFSPYFDYQHIPFRYFEPLEPIEMNFSNGLIHEASWVNDGPSPVWFGPTGDDEMMVLVMMFTLDSAGVVVVNTEEVVPQVDVLEVAPQPAQDWVQITSPDFIKNGTLKLLDMTGRLVVEQSVNGLRFTLERDQWPAGMYMYQLSDENGKTYTGKLLWSQ
ncbi:MAG: T9SS type A sorting domain-containing protein [Bacteroidota bacterium]